MTQHPDNKAGALDNFNTESFVRFWGTQRLSYVDHKLPYRQAQEYVKRDMNEWINKMSLDKNLYVEAIDLILFKYCFKFDHLNDCQQRLYKEKHMVYMWTFSKSPSWRAGAAWQLGTMKVLSHPPQILQALMLPMGRIAQTCITVHLRQVRKQNSRKYRFQRTLL